MNPLRMAWRLLRRDWRAGELRVLALALVVAVASVTSVGFFTDRVRLALAGQANALLGGDLVIEADHPLPHDYRNRAGALRLAQVETLEFPTMALSATAAQLVALKAVSPGYPLRGELRIAATPFAPDRVASGIPAPGTVWVEARVLTALGLAVGDELMLGSQRLRIAAVLTVEPARASGSVFNVAPRVMMRSDEVTATGLVTPVSRVRYQLLMAGPAVTIERLRQALEPWLGRGERIQGIVDARPEIRTALDRADRFLNLAALVSVLLAGAAVAMATRTFVRRHLDHCAVMRSLGATQAYIMTVYSLELLLIGGVAAAVGAAGGYFAQAGLARLMAPLIGVSLPPPSWLPLLWGMAIALVTLAGFALPSLWRLRHVPALRVLRRDLGLLPGREWLVHGAGLAAFVALVLWQSGDLRLGAYVVGGALATLLALLAASALLVYALRRGRPSGSAGWRLGLANIARRARSSIAQVTGYGLGMMALLVLAVMSGDLLDAWRASLAPGTPNRFLINIQPDQLTPLRQYFTANGLGEPQLYPMVRGRLIAINGRAIAPESYSDDRARRLVEREFNLSWSAQMQEDNRIVAGRWWRPGEAGRALLSVEEGLARTLGIRLGDTLSYDIAGQTFTATVSSLRQVQWDSFRANFFVIAPPGVLEGYPASYITSFYLAVDDGSALQRLLQRFPNITVLDVAAIMNQVRGMIERVTAAVEYVFLFTLAAGLAVMYATIYATFDERIRENALLRVFGARRRQLLGAMAAEFAGIGAMAGGVAATAAAAVAHLVGVKLFELDYLPDPGVWLAGIGLGALGIGMAGIAGTWATLNRPPVLVLRQV